MSPKHDFMQEESLTKAYVGIMDIMVQVQNCRHNIVSISM